jgi:hypothetical protein
MQSVTDKTDKPNLLLPCAAVLVLALTAVSFCQESARAAKKASTATTVTTTAQIPADLRPYPVMIHPMRIGIALAVPSARFACWEDGAVFIDETPIYPLKRGLMYYLTPGRLTEYASGESIALPLDKRARIASRDYRILANDKWYRGTLEILTFRGKVTVINLSLLRCLQIGLSRR